MEQNGHVWKFVRAGGQRQVRIESGADVAGIGDLDQKLWSALAASCAGLRFDRRTLELLDSDGDGRVQAPDLVAAVDFLKARGVDLDSLFRRDPDDERRLADISGKLADLAKVEPSDEEKAAMGRWERAPEGDASILPLGAATADGDAALAAAEPVLDAFFTPPADAPLVMDGPETSLPLGGNINPRHADVIAAFAEKAARPVLGDVASVCLADYRKVKAAFAPYRAWLASRPVMNANARGALVEEEREVRYRMHLAEFLRNFVSQVRLYDGSLDAMFLTGRLFIDGRECRLCFHVENEAAHAALAERSDCCLVYLRLSRSGTSATRTVCAVITAGRTMPLYAGRNGLFYDRDGVAWDATVTRVVQAQVSLVEAFWAPWRKLGEMVGGQVRKLVGDAQSKSAGGVSGAVSGIGAKAEAKGAGAAADQSASGAALASSVAALGIGVGMVGAAVAGIVGVVAELPWWQTAAGVALVMLAVSLPSVILAWFKLRRRDLGAVLNACGWAVNRPLRFSQRLARRFTVCA